MNFKLWLENSIYLNDKKYYQIIPEIKYVPTNIIYRRQLDFRPEVMKVSDEIAKNMNYLEPIEVLIFRDHSKYELDHNSPEVTLINGHHRVAAALQTNRKYLPVMAKAINAYGEKINNLIKLSNEIEHQVKKNEIID